MGHSLPPSYLEMKVTKTLKVNNYLKSKTHIEVLPSKSAIFSFTIHHQTTQSTQKVLFFVLRIQDIFFQMSNMVTPAVPIKHLGR